MRVIATSQSTRRTWKSKRSFRRCGALRVRSFPHFKGGIKLESLPWPPSHGDNMVKQFLEDAHGRSLWVTKLAKAAREDLLKLFVQNIRTEFSKLLAYVPQTCWDKYGPGTPEHRGQSRVHGGGLD